MYPYNGNIEIVAYFINQTQKLWQILDITNIRVLTV